MSRISQHSLRPTQCIVNLEQIAENYRLIKEHVNRPVMAVIKADGYGHGIIPVAKKLLEESVEYFGVAYLEEALLLREEGIQTPILVLGGILGEQIPQYIEHQITLTASSIDKLLDIEETSKKLGKRAKVHLKIDTGMERIGVHDYSADAFLSKVQQCSHIDIEGIFSHFANADAADLTHARLQLQRFQRVLQKAETMGISFQYRHMANSGAIVQLPESYLDMVRPGILLFGVYPSPEVPQKIPVQAALTWRSKVVFFKVVQPHHPVGYGSTWESDHMVRLVTIPVGYGDGYHRSMSNRAEVLIRGKRYPVVGNICMDQIMVNIEWDEVFNGDEVILLGKQGDHNITPEDLAEWAGSISYEMLTSINLRVARIYQ